jgi:hypothetical protein
MSKSKRERKREKAEEKELLWRPPSERLHYEEFQIPPYTQEHMRALLLEYLAHELFELPLHHLTLYDKLKTFYQNFQNADIYMKDIDLPETLR